MADARADDAQTHSAADARAHVIVADNLPVTESDPSTDVGGQHDGADARSILFSANFRADRSAEFVAVAVPHTGANHGVPDRTSFTVAIGHTNVGHATYREPDGQCDGQRDANRLRAGVRVRASQHERLECADVATVPRGTAAVGRAP